MDQMQDILDQDLDPAETREWIESISAVINADGSDRAHYLLERAADQARRSGDMPFDATTAYVNSIAPQDEARSPADQEMEWRIRSIIRWNAMAMIVRANRRPGGVGGHIASFGSSATLYEVGFNHFWRAPSEDHPGDLIGYQGHSSPGVYARSYLEGRLSGKQLDTLRREATGSGLPSYPHPWLMPDYWQMPTVSMGLGPVQAIYQAQFFKYLEARGFMAPSDRKVWCFIGDGEVDEVDTLGALSVATREGLDNLIFVVNCNLQRLDGPVRGNGKIVQELEGIFRGAGWNAIKLLWGSQWDPLLAKDSDGILRKRLMEAVDGEYQAFKAFGGAYTRENLFGKYAETEAMVANLSDEDIGRLNRGGHDPQKVYAAYDAAVKTKGQPTVILAKTVKGYGMGEAGESQNIAHQAKKMDQDAVRAMRDRFDIPLTDKQLEGEGYKSVPYYHPGKDSPEVEYLLARRKELGGTLPQRRQTADQSMKAPDMDAFSAITKGTSDREISTTMAVVRCMNMLVRDKTLGPRMVPIVTDEARTFGMEGMIRQLAIYSRFGQKYRPQDADQLLYYRESEDGQILQQGITEAGGVASWIAAGTSYSISNQPMLPFYIYYAFFGFRRVGDYILAGGDQRARGFLIGATAGRAFAGEGLQHSDGSSHMMANVIPNCRAWDPAFAYEIAVIMRQGVKEMCEDQHDIFYYMTAENENYAHPPMPENCEQGILKGMYQYRNAGKGKGKGKNPRVQLLGAGSMLPQVLDAADLLESDFGVKADVWSVTSFTELSRDGFDCERYNRLHPDADKPQTPYVTQCLAKHEGPIVASTDYVRAVSDQIRAFMPEGRRYTALGTDGYGRSDTADGIRQFFETDQYWMVHAALVALAAEGSVDVGKVKEAVDKYDLDIDKPNPITV